MKINGFPRQQLSFNKKGETWRKSVIDWADTITYEYDSNVRKTVHHKFINYNLLRGNLDMEDLMLLLNPEHLGSEFVPEAIQHYPIINSKLNILIGEESKRIFDYKLVVTNPTAISEIENNKKEALFSELQMLVQQSARSEEEFNKKLEKLSDYYNYEWQDMKEVLGNAALSHYIEELEIAALFNAGFFDALAVGEEIYKCDIVSGEPTIERINPLKIRVIRSGFSNKIEDADVIILEDYWSPGKIIDNFYEDLSEKDIKKLEETPGLGSTRVGEIDDRDGFYRMDRTGVFSTGAYGNQIIDNFLSLSNISGLDDYDTLGNVKVLRVYWKSRRKILKVKSYNPETGEVEYNLYPENYIVDEMAGEEAKALWINEAWEGIKIGKDIYIKMGPRKIQYNRMSNPSRCHFGIIGTFYNFNDDAPYSLCDIMKPYNYLYDVVHDRLNFALAANWGKLLKMDLAQIPPGWEIDKWMYYAKNNKLLVVDSFNEGKKGAATGKLAGTFQNNATGVVDAETGNYIQQLISILEYTKGEMSEAVGISKQREGQISNRETVGGIERATLQSTHITEAIFVKHSSLKKRVLEAFLETLKIALKGKTKKFQYILPDSSTKIMEIEGDTFAECDYGLVVKNSEALAKLEQKLDLLAQAALQNQLLDFSTIMKIYTSNSLAEIQRTIENSEKKILQRKEEESKQAFEQQEQARQAAMKMKEEELKQKEEENIRDNETKLLIANLQASMQVDSETSGSEKAQLEEKIRQFNAKHSLDREKLDLEREKIKQNNKKSNKS